MQDQRSNDYDMPDPSASSRSDSWKTSAPNILQHVCTVSRRRYTHTNHDGNDETSIPMFSIFTHKIYSELWSQTKGLALRNPVQCILPGVNPAPQDSNGQWCATSRERQCRVKVFRIDQSRRPCCQGRLSLSAPFLFLFARTTCCHEDVQYATSCKTARNLCECGMYRCGDGGVFVAH